MATMTCTASPDPTFYFMRIWDWKRRTFTADGGLVEWHVVHQELEERRQLDASMRLDLAIHLWSAAAGVRFFELWKWYNGAWIRCYSQAHWGLASESLNRRTNASYATR